MSQLDQYLLIYVATTNSNLPPSTTRNGQTLASWFHFCAICELKIKKKMYWDIYTTHISTDSKRQRDLPSTIMLATLAI